MASDTQSASERSGVSDAIDNASLNSFHWRVLLLCGLVTLIDGYDLVVMGLVVPALARDWGLAPSDFSVALSAALVGVLFGSSVAGMLGDRIGRRWTMVFMLCVAAIFMLASAVATTMEALTVYRFMTGFGAGGSIPLAIALTSEYMPKRSRNRMVVLMYAGAPLGSVFGSAIAPTLIDRFGPGAVFVVGGVAPLIVAIALVLWLPESIRFLNTRSGQGERIAGLIRKVSPGYRGPLEVDPPGDSRAPTGSIAGLFAQGRMSMTLTLWFIFFGTQFMIFLLALWMPTLFVTGGLSLTVTLYVYALYKLGGAIGGVAFGWAADTVEPKRVLMVTYPAAAMLVAALGFSIGSVPMLALVAILTGVCMIGSSLCLGALAASLYPVEVRATGVGWGLGIGRAGSILSPFIGGAALAAGTPIHIILSVAALVPLLCAAAVALLIRQEGSTKQKLLYN